MMDRYVSSHSIIKALKGTTDPPDADGPSKIEIAIFAWRNPHVFFPSKDEVLAEWILNTLGRSKGHDRCVLDTILIITDAHLLNLKATITRYAVLVSVE